MWGRRKAIPSGDEAIKNILVEAGLVTTEDVAAADAFRAEHETSYIDYFITEGIVSKEVVGKTVSMRLKVPYINLDSSRPSRQVALKIPSDLAKQFRTVGISEDDDKVTIATDNPGQANLVDEFQKVFPDKTIVVAYSLPEDISDALMGYRATFASRFAAILEKSDQVAPEIANELMSDALDHRASDLHFEPQEGGDVLMRMRIDGVLHDAVTIPATYYEAMLNNLKVRAQLRIEENFNIQDGSFRFEFKTYTVDVRMSIIPTIHGQSINLHFLGEQQPFTLSNLGLAADDREVLASAAERPYGMIIVVGPTGAGKTTTLYALLKMINRSESKIMTIEDPVEYTITGVTQIQTNPRADLTFTTGLRSILRQDPDTILVGEIRDPETARIAVNAALTGHLLLTTLHAVDAAATIPRLIELGIEPFLLASTLEIVVAQRLVRRLCQKCRTTIEVAREDLRKSIPDVEEIFTDEKIVTYQAVGCDVCNGTGYEGRVAIFEIVPMNRELQQLILSRPATQHIWQLAEKQRRRTMLEDGIEKAQKGLTTIEELLRVIPIRM